MGMTDLKRSLKSCFFSQSVKDLLPSFDRGACGRRREGFALSPVKGRSGTLRWQGHWSCYLPLNCLEIGQKPRSKESRLAPCSRSLQLRILPPGALWKKSFEKLGEIPSCWKSHPHLNETIWVLGTCFLLLVSVWYRDC